MPWRRLFALSAIAGLFLSAAADQLPADEPLVAEGGSIKTEWGQVTPQDDRLILEVDRMPDDLRLLLPPKLPQVVHASASVVNHTRQFLPIVLNADATQIFIRAPRALGKQPIELLTSEQTRQLPNGEIIFTAREANVHGEKAKLESHPGNYRIGFWSNADDYVTWDYNATRWGKYRVLLTYSTTSDGSEIEVEMGGEKVVGKLKSTGSYYAYRTIDLGDIYLAKQGKHTLTVRCLKKVGGAVMNLKSVILEPACEGTPPVQKIYGPVLLHGRDATVHGTKLRYEPAEKKQTLGYWANANDAASWLFTLTQPGTYDVEVLQGCGKGQGGSKMRLTATSAADEDPTTLDFIVEETGHFQNFKPRIVGRVKWAKPGTYRLTIQPEKIAKTAACDVRQIRLIPVKND